MAAGPYAVAGVARAGKGTDAAVAFLGRLRALAAVHPVVALAYGDVDADALEASGLADVLTRSLPGTASGTAQQHPGRRRPTSPDGDADRVGVPDRRPRGDRPGPGARSRRADPADRPARHPPHRPVLGRRPHGAHPHAGHAAGRRCAGGGAGHRRRRRRGPRVGLRGTQATAGVHVQTPAGRLGVLVADPVLGTLVGAAEHTAGGPRIAEQRYLAELAVLTLQARPGSTQTVLVAPPRTVAPGPEGAGAMMADTTHAAGPPPGCLAALQAPTGAPVGKPSDRSDPARLGGAGMTDVVGAVVRAQRPGRRGPRPGSHPRALRRGHRPDGVGRVAERSRRVPGGGCGPAEQPRGAAVPRHAARAGQRHLQPGLQRRAARADRAQRPAVPGVGAARPAGPRQPGALHRPHRRADAAAGPAHDHAGAGPRAPVGEFRGHRGAHHARRRHAGLPRRFAGEEHDLRLDLAADHLRCGRSARPAVPPAAGAVRAPSPPRRDLHPTARPVRAPARSPV